MKCVAAGRINNQILGVKGLTNAHSKSFSISVLLKGIDPCSKPGQFHGLLSVVYHYCIFRLLKRFIK